MAPTPGGIVPPIVTPFDGGEEIDGGLSCAEIDSHLEAGVRGIAVCGSTGEGTALTPAEHARVDEVTIEATDDQGPVVAMGPRRARREAAVSELRDRGVRETPP